jgi:hypothetical protein
MNNAFAIKYLLPLLLSSSELDESLELLSELDSLKFEKCQNNNQQQHIITNLSLSLSELLDDASAPVMAACQASELASYSYANRHIINNYNKTTTNYIPIEAI